MPSKPSRRLSGADLEALVEAATAVRRRAHAPYSGFKVGAAALTRAGRIHAACNVENASYGLSICAERAVMVSAVALGDADVLAIAVFSGSPSPAPPCGMCLQTLVEFCSPTTTVLLVSDGGKRLKFTLRQLLPHAFDRSYL